MSVILDALKKLEREKTERRTRHFGEEIVAFPEGRKGCGSWRMWSALAGVVALTAMVTISATVFLLPDKTHSDPVADSGITGKNLAVPTVVHVKQGKPTPVTRQTAARADFAAIPPLLPKQGSSTTPQLITEKDEGSPALSPPVLKVSGIAWNENHADRRAVVNGLLVGEGAVVEGATIVTIYSDKVRFSSFGRVFETAVAGSEK